MAKAPKITIAQKKLVKSSNLLITREGDELVIRINMGESLGLTQKEDREKVAYGRGVKLGELLKDEELEGWSLVNLMMTRDPDEDEEEGDEEEEEDEEDEKPARRRRRPS